MKKLIWASDDRRIGRRRIGTQPRIFTKSFILPNVLVMRYVGYYPAVLVVVVSTSSMYCVKLLLVLIQYEYYCYIMTMVNILPYL